MLCSYPLRKARGYEVESLYYLEFNFNKLLIKFGSSIAALILLYYYEFKKRQGMVTASGLILLRIQDQEKLIIKYCTF